MKSIQVYKFSETCQILKCLICSNLITLIISVYWDAFCDACLICGKVKESLYNHNDAGTNLEGQRWDCVFTQIFFGISLPFVFFMLDWHLDIWARIGEKHIALEKVVVEQNPQKLYWLKVFLEFYQPRRLEHCFLVTKAPVVLKIDWFQF